MLTNMFLLNLHVFNTTASFTLYKIHVQAYDSSTVFTGECVKFIYALVT